MPNQPTPDSELPDKFLELCAYAKLTVGQSKQVWDYVARSNLDAQLSATEHVKQICPVTEGMSVERLHNRIDTYIDELRKEREQYE